MYSTEQYTFAVWLGNGNGEGNGNGKGQKVRGERLERLVVGRVAAEVEAEAEVEVREGRGHERHDVCEQHETSTHTSIVHQTQTQQI